MSPPVPEDTAVPVYIDGTTVSSSEQNAFSLSQQLDPSSLQEQIASGLRRMEHRDAPYQGRRVGSVTVRVVLALAAALGWSSTSSASLTSPETAKWLLKHAAKMLRLAKTLSLSAVKVVFVALAAAFVVRKLRGDGDDGSKPPKHVKRVAVVGGGIAGVSAAWSLAKAGLEVVIFEKRPKLGGNAKAFTWTVPPGPNYPQGGKFETGIAVMAYPHHHCHTTGALLDALNLPRGTIHELRYMCAERNARDVETGQPQMGKREITFCSGDDFEKPAWLKADIEKWDSLSAIVRKVNGFFQPSEYTSLYRMSLLNPLNVVPMRALCRLWGISDYFWERVFVPVHTSTFLETNMDSLPAVLMELLDDLVPFSKVPEMIAWPEGSYGVIDMMGKQLPQGSVRTSCAVESIRFTKREGSDEVLDAWVVHEDLSEEDAPEKFDAVVMACSAPAIHRVLHGAEAKNPLPATVGTPTKGHNSSFFSWLEDFVLRKTVYTLDVDQTFNQGVVHSDPSILPEVAREHAMAHCCNYMEIDGAGNPADIENSFIISSWWPGAKETGVPMLVTFNPSPKEKMDGVDALWTVTSKEAHPRLTIWQMAVGKMLWPMLQGQRNNQVFFCGSAVTLGNGHDMSMLSGFVVASKLGAKFPFPQTATRAHDDFKRLNDMMFKVV